MLDLETLRKHDKLGMYKVYDIWPHIAKEAYQSEQDLVDFRHVDHVVFAGMGGSGALADIFSSILSKTNIHVTVVKGYHLPKTVDSNTLIVTSSISGNTVETLTVLDSAFKSKFNIIAFSSGGTMEQYCIRNRIEHKKIHQVHSPRASFTRFLYVMLKVLSSVIPVKKQDVFDSIKKLENLEKRISSANLNEKNPSLDLAEWIGDIPIIYYPYGLAAAAIRFKNSLQENAKIHAMAEDVLEASHNGVVSWEKKSIVQPIMVEGADDYIKTKERWNILKEYFKENDINYREIFSVEGSILSKLINLIYLLDYCTIYRAVLSGIDPSPIRSIDFIKKRL